MIENILSNVAAGIICTVLAYAARKIFTFITAPSDSPANGRKYSKILVRNQFLITLFTLVFSLPVGVLLNATTALLALAKILLLFVAGFSFIFLWGSFDAAFEFYPDDNTGNDEPTCKSPDQTEKK